MRRSRGKLPGSPSCAPDATAPRRRTPWTASARSGGGRGRPRPAQGPGAAAPAAPEFDPSKPPRAYSAQGTYLPGERIVHPSFGTGVVAGSPGPGKVDVVFPTGARTLACAKAASTLERPIAVANVPIEIGRAHV